MVLGQMKTLMSTPAGLDAIVDLALRDPIARSRQILGPNAERLWLRRADDRPQLFKWKNERLRHEFDSELRGLHTLTDAGMPVPDLLSEGPSHFVVSDAGISLAHLLVRLEAVPGKRTTAFRAAGAALGRLHRSGFALGRPTIGNICWDGDEARFTEVGRLSSGQSSGRKTAFDLIVFVHSFMTKTGRAGPDLDWAMRAYRTAAPEKTWANLQAAARWIAPLSYLAAALGWLGAKYPELRAVPKTVAYLRMALAA